MKKILRRLAVLFIVFVLGVAGTALLLNSETTDDRSDMNSPTFPEIMVDMGGNYANRMYGYSQPMQADFTRDSVTPLDTTKKLTFVINPYNAKVKSLSYEIRTSDGSKVLENRKIKNLGTTDKYLTANVEIGSDLRMNQEYSMEISLDTSEGTVYYYTRVVSRSQLNTSQYISFVKSFYEKCMDKSSADDLSAYLEPSSDGSATNFANISINSSLSEVSWGKLKPKIYKKGIPVIKDINETTASVSLEYQISAKNSDGVTEIYDVTEFYRMRYTEARIMLLDFERTTNQIFNPNHQVVSKDGLLLGIRDKDVNYMLNDSTDMIAFVQQGDLWSYSPSSGKIAQIFSFRKTENGDFRDSRLEHDIKIIRVSDDGDVDFVLYGYMNRGTHEGSSGVCVYHYNSDQNVVEEKVFIPTTESYEFLEADLGVLSYVNQEEQLFLLFARKLYQVDINEGGYKILEEGISNSNFIVSRTNAHAAWLVGSGDDKGKIKEIAFDTGETRLITPKEGRKLRTVGFLNEDMIYGVLLDKDILTDENGHTSEGIRVLKIEDFQGNVKKEYRQKNLFITNISVGSTLIEFDLAVKSGSTYTTQKKDNIMNNSQTASRSVTVELVTGSTTGVQIRLAMEEEPETEEPLVVYAKMRSTQAGEVTLDTQIPDDTVYYVYAGGGLDRTYRNAGNAVRRADAKGGVVLNRAQQYVWERGNKKTKLQLNTEDIPEAMRNGFTTKKELQEAMGEEGTIIDLSGCTLDSVLYEVSAQRPVIAKTGSDTSVVIVGYDEYNTYLYDPVKKETYPYGMNDSTELFEKAGNIFISYIESVNY